METRNYYVPRTHYAKMVIDRIVLMVPCCVPAIKPKDFASTGKCGQLRTPK